MSFKNIIIIISEVFINDQDYWEGEAWTHYWDLNLVRSSNVIFLSNLYIKCHVDSHSTNYWEILWKGLACLSIEHELTRTVNVSDIITDFTKRKLKWISNYLFSWHTHISMPHWLCHMITRSYNKRYVHVVGPLSQGHQ